MDISNVKELIKAVSESDLTSFQYNEGNVSIALGKNDHEETVTDLMSSKTTNSFETTEKVEAVAPEAESGVAENNDTSGNLVKTPLVGTIYLAPGEKEEPFVKVGDTVKKGQVVAIVEAMKLMNEIESEYDGVVKEVLVGNGEVVEYGQPLFRV